MYNISIVLYILYIPRINITVSHVIRINLLQAATVGMYVKRGTYARKRLPENVSSAFIFFFS